MVLLGVCGKRDFTVSFGFGHYYVHLLSVYCQTCRVNGIFERKLKSTESQFHDIFSFVHRNKPAGVPVQRPLPVAPWTYLTTPSSPHTPTPACSWPPAQLRRSQVTNCSHHTTPSSAPLCSTSSLEERIQHLANQSSHLPHGHNLKHPLPIWKYFSTF